MSALEKPRITPAEYLALERAADHKSEYIPGEILAMAGASEAHNTITLNVGRELSLQLRGRDCRAYVNDMRVRISPTGAYVYPDAVATCGPRRFDDTHQDTLLNPTVIIEVLSPSTEAYDRGEKWAHYRQLETLQEYVLISQERCRVERYVRQPKREGDLQLTASAWLLTDANDLTQSVPLESVSAQLALSAIYENIVFPVKEIPTP